MRIDISTARAVTPKIYAYTTPGVTYHDGWIKIGYTERDVERRIREQTVTADIRYNLEWTGAAMYVDTRELFTDREFHAYLQRQGIERNHEWFRVTGAASWERFCEFRRGRELELERETLTATPYTLRDEQELAVKMTIDYWCESDGEFLWNAKPRFGKTLAVYDLCKRIGARKILIVTNRPAIANSWYEEYVRFVGGDYFFVSEVDALKDKPHVLSRAEFSDIAQSRDAKLIEFVSLQDLKGSIYFGGTINKLREVWETAWDILVVDEAHEGVDTFKTNVAFDRIKRGFTLHLSGTPFKALANKKFPAAAIFNWTYADEQSAKNSWNDADGENPYATLPRLNLYTYQMSEIVRDELKRGIEIDGELEDYAFDLNEFFATRDGKFLHDSSVDKFLDALTTQKKFPFSTAELRDELRHTLWLLERVDSARALAEKLKAHEVFRDYKIVLAAGRLDDDAAIKNSFDAVTEAIAAHERTITLSVGQLTTGVTVPQWTGVLMLANVQSPALYMQAAFRAQNPCLFRRGENFLRKENAYVFDFDPARTLKIFEAFANDLAGDTSGGGGSSERRQANIRELLNFFPVIGEYDDGELIELDAAKILTIPRKIRSVEVVRRGFMSDFLFANIAHIFHAPPQVIEIISRLPTAKDVAIDLGDEIRDAADELYLDDDGEISLPEKFVIGRAAELFGDKIFGASATVESVVAETLDIAQKNYGGEFKQSERAALTRQLIADGNNLVERLTRRHDIDRKILAQEFAADELEIRQRAAEENFQAELASTMADFAQFAAATVVETVESRLQTEQKNSVADDVRDHLRGFARTIPSFIMAYGVDRTITLATFDKIVPNAVFEELTGITLEQFRYLRDTAKLFDEVTFDDAIAEFLRLRVKLADYFAEGREEDIFDYIPPQRTNQIFTPKETAKFMADMLAAECPDCFDAPEKSFVDPYMKSGLFVAELVRRLYRSPRHKELFPDKAARLRHIFGRQIYGLAPTEIIYRIAKNYLLGFDVAIARHNLRLADALPAAKDERLAEFLDGQFDLSER